MSSESTRNQSTSQIPRFPAPLTGPLPIPEQARWNPQPAGQLSDAEEGNRYHHFHHEWVARAYALPALSLPPQHFFQDPMYPPYLRNIGITILVTYMQHIQIQTIQKQETIMYSLSKTEIIKCTERFDCSVQAVMGDIVIQAKVHQNTCNRMELGGEAEGEGEDMEVEEVEEVGERERSQRKKKQEWREQPGTGMLAGKHQRFSQDQDENPLPALEVQDKKAGKLYKEALTTGIDMLVQAITKGSQPAQSPELEEGIGYSESAEQRREERLSEYEKKLNELIEAQKIVQQKLDNSVREHAEAEKRSGEQQEKMMELLQLLTKNQM
ncbi:hypothetical protein C7212DRAFT_340965 [Tuber magnatum]|uniref:Uncharacterized protein n=1 Tax=Tuber magnatum TaxID=42249 RepID=A0A317T2B8_9PEZI|nr:hypothetical protein C7212DRAFT_340965 [Tuber magnatum]